MRRARRIFPAFTLSPLHPFILLLAGCHAHSTAPTETLTGHFVSYSPHMLNMEVDSPGNLNQQRMLPMNDHVKVLAGSRQIALEKIQPFAAIKVTRNLQTHQVTRIELSN